MARRCPLLRGAILTALAAILAGTLTSQSAPATSPAAPSLPWTFLIYAAIDNDAEADGNFFAFLRGVRAAHADDPGVEILLFADRSDRYSTNATELGEDFTDARLYRVRSGACERLDGGAEFPEITRTSRYEADSADPVNLRKFLAWAKARHPARHYALLLYGHADGHAMCPDEQSGHEMGFAQVTDTVPAELSVDLLACELCNMAGIEIAYQWRPGNGGFAADWYVAIPNAGPPLDWDRVFARLRTAGKTPDAIDPASLTPQRLGELIVAEGGNGRAAAAQRNERHARMVANEAVTCCDLRQAGAVKAAVDALAVELAKADARAGVAGARGPGDGGDALNYVRDRLAREPYVDLYDFATRLAHRSELAPPAQKAARAVAAAADALVVASWGGSGLARFVPGRCGVFLVLPTTEDQDAWRRFAWYTPRRVPGTYGSLSWCRDGAKADDGIVQNWFELLDSWLDQPGPAGGSNGVAH